MITQTKWQRKAKSLRYNPELEQHLLICQEAEKAAEEVRALHEKYVEEQERLQESDKR